MVLALCAGAAALAQDELPPEEALAKALRHEKEGGFRKALAVYDSFLQKHPAHVQALNVLYRTAICYDSIGQPDKAAEVFEKVIAAGPNRNFRHRAHTFVKLAKLHGEAKRYEAGVKVLKDLLQEGAALYEDEAQNLCGGYYALLGNFDEAAIMFNVLKQKINSPLAKEAAYKLAVVWMRAGRTELAKHAVEEFAQRYPGHPRVLELLLRVSRHFFDNKKYKSALAVCSQVQRQYKTRPEALEAAFIIALCYRESGNLQRAVEAFDYLVKMPQAAHNSILASEAMFEAARIYHHDLKNVDSAMEFYRRAAYKAREGATDRQKRILEHSLFHLAEHHFRNEEWSAALDLYLQMREIDTKINVLGRILHCQSKIDKYGAAAISAESEEERKFILARIAANPGTSIALQGEVFLLDKRLETATRDARRSWQTIEKIIAGFRKLVEKYPDGILKQQDMRPYIMMRMASAYSALNEESLVPDLDEKWKSGLNLYEQALGIAPDTLFRVEMLEGVAILAHKLGQTRKAFDAYKRLYEITGKEPQQPRKEGTPFLAEETKKDAFEYIRGLSTIADTPDLVEEAIATLNEVIVFKPANSPEGREARFYLGELYFMKKRYSDAAGAYLRFIRQYGPPMDLGDNVLEGWVKPRQVDDVLDKVYEAGTRIAHCWYAQGHRNKMVKAYEWVVKNQDHRNPRMAEALYATIIRMHKGTGLSTAEKKEQIADALWKKIVNPSMDFGSEPFKQGFHFWLRHPVAVPFVKNAILKSGELYSGIGRHGQAAEIFRQYLEIFAPEEPKGRRRRDGTPRFPRDDMYDIASYAVGREYIQTGDFESMAYFYRPYVEGLRTVQFRPSILKLLGHYGTEGELFQDAREAYAALLDEYGIPNPRDENDLPIPVPKEKRLRPGSSWNGIRMEPPEGLDLPKVRYSLGYLYRKKEDWRGCKRALDPFHTDERLKAAAPRPGALLMLGRSYFNLKDDEGGIKVLASLVRQHPRFKAVEEAFVDLAKGCARAKKWTLLDGFHSLFVERHEGSPRRPYMDLYQALSMIAKGREKEGMSKLRGLSRADTYRDLKADALYYTAVEMLKSESPDRELALKQLELSIKYHPRAEALLEAGRCAVALGKWREARLFLDRCRLEFPKSDQSVLDNVKDLLAKVAEAEAKR